MNLLYLLTAFPKTSETFIINEIDWLLKDRHSIKIMSLYTPQQFARHGNIDEILINTDYLDRFSKAYKLFLLLRLGFAVVPVLNKLLHFNEKYGFEFSDEYVYKNILPLAGYVYVNRIEHMHCHFADKNAKLAFLLSKALGIPYSLTVHGYDIYFQAPIQYPALIDGAKFCLTVSQANKKYLIENYGAVAESIQVLPIGINTDYFKRSSRVRSVGRIVTVARLAPVKALHYAIEAAHIVKKRNLKFKWLIIGDGDEYSNLMSKIELLNLEDDVVLLGSKADSEVRELLNESNIFVLTSISEGLGVCLMEALSMECAVIATNVGGVSELVIQGYTGILVPPQSATAIADAITCFLENPELVNELGQNGRMHIVNNFSISKQAQKLIDLFNNAV